MAARTNLAMHDGWRGRKSLLDKTVPYFNVIMRRSAGLVIPRFILPRGFSLSWFVEGDEARWADIETSVGEFDDVPAALKYFQERYVPYLDELKRRLLLVRAANGDWVGTISAWWNYTGAQRDASIHWLAVRPAYQGLGLGKVLVSECLYTLLRLEGDVEVFLHTQTWSHRAIGIYFKAGFEIVQRETFGEYQNDYDQAMPVLRRIIPTEWWPPRRDKG